MVRLCLSTSSSLTTKWGSVRGLTRPNDQTPYSIRLPTTRRQSRQSHSLYPRRSTVPTTNLWSRVLEIYTRRMRSTAFDSMRRSDVIRTPHKERSLPFPVCVTPVSRETLLPCLSDDASRIRPSATTEYCIRDLTIQFDTTRCRDRSMDVRYKRDRRCPLIRSLENSELLSIA
jgi:hypothetical protein